jgi:hypothetical protein
VIADRAAGGDAEDSLAELMRLCDEAGVDPELLLEEARPRATRMHEFPGCVDPRAVRRSTSAAHCTTAVALTGSFVRSEQPAWFRRLAYVPS